MVDIKLLHVHAITYQDHKGKSKRVIKKIKPSQPDNKLAMQQDIGEAVKKLRDTGKYEYWYVVVEIDRGGQSAYRTIVPKTMF